MLRKSQQEKTREPAAGRSRRGLLAGAAAALGLLAGETVLGATPAQAGTDGDVILDKYNPSSGTTSIDNSSEDHGVDTATFFAITGFKGIAVLGQNYGTGAALYGLSAGGEGLYAQSGSVQGTNPGSTRNGVHGVTNSPSDSGVWGEAVAGGTGVAGVTTTKGTGSNAGVAGVNLGGGPGVAGQSNGGAAVYGAGSPGGIGVLATSVAAGGTALQVQGRSMFSRSGLVPITPPSYATVFSPPGGLSGASLAFALPQNLTSGVFVQAAVPDPATGTLTIYLNRAPTSPVYIAWFIVN